MPDQPAEPSHPPRRVGVLGGMGPAATVDLMAKVLAATPATRDEDHVPLIVWNVPQVPPRPAAARGEGPSPLPAMLEGVRFLEKAGATALAIACNTAHHWARELQDAVAIPLLHIAHAALEDLTARIPAPACVGLLGTRATMQLGIYDKPLRQRGIPLVMADEALQAAIDRAIALVKAGKAHDAQCTLDPVLRAMLERGADVIVLGCTELPLVPVAPDIAGRLVDPTTALARRIVRHSLGVPCEARTPHVS